MRYGHAETRAARRRLTRRRRRGHDGSERGLRPAARYVRQIAQIGRFTAYLLVGRRRVGLVQLVETGRKEFESLLLMLLTLWVSVQLYFCIFVLELEHISVPVDENAIVSLLDESVAQVVAELVEVPLGFFERLGVVGVLGLEMQRELALALDQIALEVLAAKRLVFDRVEKVDEASV